MHKEKINEFIESRQFARIMIGVAVVAGVVVVFRAGMEAGYRRADFNNRFDQSYYRTNGDRPRGFFGDMPGTHGATGRIESVALPTFVVEDNGAEKVVRIGAGTDIRLDRNSVGADALKAGDTVIVLGTPNEQAEVEAQLVRILPAEAKTQVMEAPVIQR